MIISSFFALNLGNMAQIKHEQTHKGGAFYYEDRGNRLAEMVYVMQGDNLMIIEHTDVDESLQGRGVGKQLQAELVAYVRERGIKVLPLCPFAKAMFQRTAEWQDVLS